MPPVSRSLLRCIIILITMQNIGTFTTEVSDDDVTPIDVTPDPYTNVESNSTNATTPSRISIFGTCVVTNHALGKTRPEIWCICANLCTDTAKGAKATQEGMLRLYLLRDEKNWQENKAIYITMISIYGVGMILGISGNLLVIVAVIRYLHRESATNIFLGALAAADLLLVIVCFPLKVMEKVMTHWIAGHATCLIAYFLRDFSFCCSTLTLTLISIERYTAICRPMKAQRVNSASRFRRLLILVWVLAAALASPNFYIMDFVNRDLDYYTGQFMCTTRRVPGLDYVLLPRIYHTCLFVVVFFVPMVIMTCSYGRVSYALWQSVKKSEQLSGQNSKSENGTGNRKPSNDARGRLHVIRLLVLVLVMFFVCWFPTLSVSMVATLAGHPLHKNTTFYLETFAYMNSCINPVLYVFLSSQFRKAFLALIRCSKYMKDAPGSSVTTTSSVASTRTRQDFSQIPEPSAANGT